MGMLFLLIYFPPGLKTCLALRKFPGVSLSKCPFLESMGGEDPLRE
jgi:hypothetical protein